MFITNITSDPQFFVYVIVTMVLSVVLHELAHGWAAIWQGDRTPIEQGHMTVDPRVHMGMVSLLMLAFVGMCFGAMPVNPTRFRHRHSAMIVAAAGPLMNLLLALLALTGLGIWDNIAGADPTDGVGGNLHQFLWFFGYANISLCIFNLVPIPPLDGSTVLAGMHKGYRRLIAEARDPRMFLFAFVVLFLLLNSQGIGFFTMGAQVADHYLYWLHSFGR
jgi:Zn-dependent protease